MNIGIIGLGYWGPNIVRNLSILSEVNRIIVYDTNINRIKEIKKLYPFIQSAENHQKIISDPSIDLVCIITPPNSHFKLGKLVLESGKHLFIEKPFTSTSDEAKILIELADQKEKIIMVDYTFLFTPSVQKIKSIIESNELGNIYYYDSRRINLGLIQSDKNVIWDLAPHDLSIINYIIKEKPIGVSSQGVTLIKSNNKSTAEQIAFVTLYFQSNLIAHFNFNWLSPIKIRDTLIGGSKKMLKWNDLNTDEKIKIYDKGANFQYSKETNEYLINYRIGNMVSPKVEQKEALKLELEYLIDCIKKKKEPHNNGQMGLYIVKLLEACDQSLSKKGKMINL